MLFPAMSPRGHCWRTPSAPSPAVPGASNHVRCSIGAGDLPRPAFGSFRGKPGARGRTRAADGELQLPSCDREWGLVGGLSPVQQVRTVGRRRLSGMPGRSFGERRGWWRWVLCVCVEDDEGCRRSSLRRSTPVSLRRHSFTQLPLLGSSCRLLPSQTWIFPLVTRPNVPVPAVQKSNPNF